MWGSDRGFEGAFPAAQLQEERRELDVAFQWLAVGLHQALGSTVPLLF